jgi:Mn-dependent DtxR family transcriptional regulator
VAKREAAARLLVAELARVTGNRPTRPRGLHTIARALKISCDEALAAVEDAEAKGWLTIEAGHSVCLTDEGRVAALEKAARHPVRRHRL